MPSALLKCFESRRFSHHLTNVMAGPDPAIQGCKPRLLVVWHRMAASSRRSRASREQRP
jgi:hypothetical protein